MKVIHCDGKAKRQEKKIDANFFVNDLVTIVDKFVFLKMIQLIGQIEYLQSQKVLIIQFKIIT